MSGKRNPEADRDGKFRCAAGTPQKRREIVGQGILRAGDTSPRNQVEKTGGTGRDFFEALIRGSRRAEENRIEMVSGEDAAILFRFFRRQIGGQNAVRTSGRGGGCEFLEPHLQDRIVVAEEDERNLGGLSDPTNEIEDSCQCCPGFKCALGGTLDRRAIGKGIAERHAKFDHVRTGFGERQDEFQRRVERRIARRDIGDDAKFPGSTQFSKAFGNASRLGRDRRHGIWESLKIRAGGSKCPCPCRRGRKG